MAKEISLIGLIRQNITERGYDELKNASRKKKREAIYYVHKKSSPIVTHVLELTYKPALNAYGVHVGVYNQEAERLMISWLPELKKFLHPLVAKSFFERDADGVPMPSGQFFEACRYLGWQRLVIPDPDDRSGWPKKIDELFKNLLEPIFFRVKNVEDIKSLLLRSDPTFEWFMTNAILRVSVIVALDFLCEKPEPNLRERLYAFKDEISRALVRSEVKDYDVLFDFLFSQGRNPQ